MGTIIRPAEPGDADACGAVCYRALGTVAERHAFSPDLASEAEGRALVAGMLGRDEVYGMVAEADGQVVGCAFLFEFWPVASIGPVAVEPTAQDRGLGRRLMEALLARCRDKSFPAVRLVQAAYNGRSLALYVRLGFVPREPLTLMQGQVAGGTVAGCSVRDATDADLGSCDDLARRTHGHSRSVELRQAARLGNARVVVRDGRVTGYTTGVGFFGHSVGESADDLKALIAAAQVYPGTGFLLPTRNAVLLHWCLGRGLRAVQPMTLMTLGLYNDPACPYIPSIKF